MITGIVKAVCVSQKKGTEKQNVDRVHVKPRHGIVGDAHAGDWHRQVSLLSYDKVKAFNEKGANVDHGALGRIWWGRGLIFGDFLWGAFSWRGRRCCK